MSDAERDGAFYFDLASPLSYLAAERVLHVLPGPLPWVPILARELPDAERLQAWRCENEESIFRCELERRALALGLQPLRWPGDFPFDSSLAMRAATYARGIGRVVAFAQAAFRQAFAAGHSLADSDFVAIAGAACEVHPRALLGGAALYSVSKELQRATEHAALLGVSDVPAVRLGGRTFVGEGALEGAAALCGAWPAGTR